MNLPNKATLQGELCNIKLGKQHFNKVDDAFDSYLSG